MARKCRKCKEALPLYRHHSHFTPYTNLDMKARFAYAKMHNIGWMPLTNKKKFYLCAKCYSVFEMDFLNWVEDERLPLFINYKWKLEEVKFLYRKRLQNASRDIPEDF